ncbi:N-acetylglucosamine kinase [Algibacillus agarilyticus]|uniref:N-acetylglucosamine kinase n=1 Tax=Algibacillus agarilyticus TaxID=2234133 RepID=UPI000DCF8F4C|nr:BadF/BadG/BcrA/BcrD ATPase family protein [Algibacillus agarilyticus]
MLTSDINKNELFLGIDGGGTKCKAIVVNRDNAILGTGISGPGNPLHGFEQAANSIEESAKLALADAGLQHIALHEIPAGVGLAGVNLPVLYKQMNEWLHPFKEMYLATDLLIACLGAHQGEYGAVMITGTGSCGFAHVDDDVFMLGGHGFPHGDKGSGAWTGFQAAKQVLLSLDQLIPATALTPKLLAHLKVNNAVEMVEVIAGKPAAFFAEFARDVYEAARAGDDIARAIVQEGAGYISQLARKLLTKNPPRISLIGGLTPVITPWLDADVQETLSAPLSPPEMGSVIYARQQQAKQSKIS